MPRALLEADDFQSLNDAAKKDLTGRLNYIEEIGDNIREWLDRRDESLVHFLDNLELDASVNVGVKDAENTISTWLIHTSWTFEFEARELQTELGPTIQAALNASLPSNESSIGTLSAWLEQEAVNLTKLLDGFYAAASYRRVVACLIALDALILRLLLVATLSRFNAQISERRTKA